VSPKTTGLYGKLNDQIVHITYGRSDAPEEKINDESRAYLKELIEKEIDNFSRHIEESYRHVWKYKGEFQSRAPLIRQGSTTTSEIVTQTVGPTGPNWQPPTAVGATGPIDHSSPKKME
jgi:hypothetical protein